MSSFFHTSYESDTSSDEESLYYSDDERYLKQLQNKKSVNIQISNDTDDDSSDEELLSDSSDDEKIELKKEEDVEEASGDDDDDDDSDDWSNDDDSDSDSDSDDSDAPPRGRSYFLKKDFLKGGNDSDSDSGDEKKIVKSAKEKYLDELLNLSNNIENLSMVEEWVKIGNEFDKLFKLAYKHNQYHILIPRSYIKAISILDDLINKSKNDDDDEEENNNKKVLSSSESKSLNILKQKIKREVKTYNDEVLTYKKDPEAYENIKDDSNLINNENQDQNNQLIVSAENLFFIVQSIIDSRGKKGIDLNEHLNTLNKLLDLTNSTYEKIIILNLLISLRYELNSKDKFMSINEWLLTLNDISKLLDILDNDKSYVITENAPSNDNFTKPPPANENGLHLIGGSISSFVERLSDELTTHLLYIDPNSSEYIKTLQNDSKLYSIIIRCQSYLTRIISIDNYSKPEGEQINRIIIKRLENIYYKPIKLIIFSELNNNNNNINNIPKINSSEIDENLNKLNTNNLIDSLCSHIYKYSNGISSSIYRKRAALMQSYYYSITNQFFKARDILHLTHVQATIHTSEPGVQVLFNRAIVQLGLAAFRSGLIEETQIILHEVVTSQHTRDLLGQGRIYFNNNLNNQTNNIVNNTNNNQFNNYNNLNTNNISENGKFVPFHTHVNIELVDIVYYISSLLIEVPLIALQSYQSSTNGANNLLNNELQLQSQNINKNTSRSFKRILDYTERQYFQGPPEETRDYIFDAYHKLIKFNWFESSKILSNLKVWVMMPGISTINENGENGLELLKEMLIKLCKFQSLKTWAYVNAGIIKNYSIKKLSKRFELNEDDICGILGSLISNEEIKGYLKINDDNNSKWIIFENKENGINQIIRGLTTKVNSILERNEKLSLGGYQIMLKKK